MASGARCIGATGVIRRDLRRAADTRGVTREAVAVIHDAVRNGLFRGGHPVAVVRGSSRRSRASAAKIKSARARSGK